MITSTSRSPSRWRGQPIASRPTHGSSAPAADRKRSSSGRSRRRGLLDPARRRRPRPGGRGALSRGDSGWPVEEREPHRLGLSLQRRRRRRGESALARRDARCPGPGHRPGPGPGPRQRALAWPALLRGAHPDHGRELPRARALLGYLRHRPMTARRLRVAAAVALMLVGGAGGAAAQTYATPKTEAQFRVEWQAGKSRKGASILEGYVYDPRPTGATDVRVLVDILDA